MRFKAEAIKHLPVLIFGDRQKLTEGAHGRLCSFFNLPSPFTIYRTFEGAPSTGSAVFCLLDAY